MIDETDLDDMADELNLNKFEKNKFKYIHKKAILQINKNNV